MTSNTIVVLIVCVIIIGVGIILTKSYYTDTTPHLDRSLSYDELKVKINQLRQMAYEYETVRDSAAIKETVDLEILKHDNSVKIIAANEARVLTNIADAYEKITKDHDMSSDVYSNNGQKRTRLIPDSGTNCVGDRGNSIYTQLI